MSARSSASVSNSLADARQLVVEPRQHLLLDLLDVHLDRRRVDSSASSYATLFVSPGRGPMSAASTSSTSRPEPSSTTVSRCASPSGETMSTTSVSPSRAGTPVGGTSSATDSRSASSSCVDELLRHLGRRAGRPRARASRRSRPSAARARSPGSSRPRRRRSGSSYSYCGCATGRIRARGGGVPEPARDVAVDRLGVDPLLAEPLRRAPAAAPCRRGSPGS